MSIEEANKSRFECGLMNLTELEGELLEALELMLHRFEGRTVNLFSQRSACSKARKQINKTYGHD